MGIDQRQKQLVEEFAEFTDWEDRYRRIIELGRDLPGLPEELKQDKFLVRGCQSQVWLHAALEDGERVVFRADSDAMIVRGQSRHPGASSDPTPVPATPPIS